MKNRRLYPSLSNMIALPLAGIGCMSLRDLSSYSAGSSGPAAPASLQDTMDSEASADAGEVATVSVEGQDPSSVALAPGVPVVQSEDCEGPGEFTAPEASSCYRLDEAAGSWRDARDLCEAWGGELARIRSREEGAWLGQRTDRNAWIGASDFADEGTFRWLDGDDLDDDAPWGPGQPDNFEGREDCVELRAGSGLFNDAPCMRDKLALCERTSADGRPR